MGKWVHRLYNIDSENRRANCSNCGPVDLVVNSTGGRLGCGVGVREAKKRYNKKRYYKSPDKIGPPERAALRKAIRVGVLCEICGDPAEVADHCHATKVWRGPLCVRCNLGLGFFEDNVGIMKAAIHYVIKYQPS